MARIIRYIVLFFFLFLGTAYPATYFADTGGSGTTCSEGSPCTLDYSVETKATDTDTVSINDGTYTIGQLIVPDGVSLISTSSDNTKVKIQPSGSLGINDPLILLSSAAGSGEGDQTISYLEIDGINGANIARVGIGVKSRDNVRITQCNIHDFYGVINAATVEVQSVTVSPSSSWWTYWPADPQEPGTDTNIDALWPANPVSGFQLDNNTIDDGGFYSLGQSRTGSVTLWHLKDSTIHHNTFDNTTSRGEAIAGLGLKTALMDNVDVYNNTFTMGTLYTDESSWSIEVWNLKGGCDFYNNTGNWWYSITVGKETKIYDNTLIQTPASTYPYGIGIEFNMQSYGVVEGNYLQGALYGVIAGFSLAGAKAWETKKVIIRNNAIFNTELYPIWINCISASSALNAVVSDIEIYNDTLDGNASRGTYGIYVQEEDRGSGTCTLSNVNVKNNSIRDMVTAAGVTQGTPASLVIDYNNFYNNGAGWAGEANTVSGDPLHASPGDGTYIGYTLGVGSPAIDAGIHLTTANGAGNATDQFVMTHAGYFHPLDYIWVNTDTTDFLVQILSIVYSTNTATLAAAKTWNTGAEVFPAYSSAIGQLGADVDMGAIEYAMFMTAFTPASGATGQSITVDGNWTNPTGTTTNTIYFDVKATHDPPTTELHSGSAVETHDFGTLAYDTEYAWRNDIVHAGGTQTGVVYYFTTTTELNPPTPPGGGDAHQENAGAWMYHKNAGGAK